MELINWSHSLYGLSQIWDFQDYIRFSVFPRMFKNVSSPLKNQTNICDNKANVQLNPKGWR